MKHSLEGSNGHAVPKQRHVKEVERNVTPKDLETINFVGCMHRMIWFVERWEASWVEKACFTQLWKFDWTKINSSIVIEMICNYQVIDEMMMLQRKQIKLQLKL